MSNVLGDKFEELRKRAQMILGLDSKKPGFLSKNKLKRLLFELNTYQIELELQNEDLRNAQSELIKTNLRYTDLYEFIPVGYLTINGKGVILDANITASELLGIPRADLIEQSITNFIVDDDQDIYYFHSLKIKEINLQQICELRIKRMDNSVFPAQIQSLAKSFDHGEPDEIRMTISNMSEIKEIEKKNKKLEEQVHHLEKVESMGRIAGGVAHDFNNALNVIINAAELLKRPERKLDEKAISYIDMILDISINSSELIDKLLLYSHKGNLKTTPLNIRDLIRDTVDLLGNSLNREIFFQNSLESDGFNILGDRATLQSLLINLCLNASHAIDSNGQISITADRIHLHKILCDSYLIDIPEGEYIEIEVSDDGCGISPKIIDKIFDPYFTTGDHCKGTGLGLSTVLGIVKNHQGAIRVSSELGMGTSFYIYLPTTDLNVQEVEDKQTTYTGRGVILFVDDEPLIRIVGQDVLKSLGFDVILAEDGQECIDIFKKQQNTIDLVILDMIMPKKTGTEVFKILKEIKENCKVIITTGFTFNENLEELYKSGLSGFIYKPYNVMEISEIINNVLSS